MASRERERPERSTMNRCASLQSCMLPASVVRAPASAIRRLTTGIQESGSGPRWQGRVHAAPYERPWDRPPRRRELGTDFLRPERPPARRECDGRGWPARQPLEGRKLGALELPVPESGATASPIGMTPAPYLGR